MSARTRWLALAAVLLAVGATGAWLAWPRPTPTTPDDTGMDDEAQRELMQEIGYLK